MPVDPEVLGKEGTCKASSTFLVTMAVSTTLSKDMSPGSRSITLQSGYKAVCARECQGLSSMHPRFTMYSSDASSVQIMKSLSSLVDSLNLLNVFIHFSTLPAIFF